MILLPAIDLKDGKCVQLVGGDPTQAKVQVDDPVGQAARFIEQGASRIHIVDLDAALDTGRDNTPILRDMLRGARVPMQVGGGVRSTARIEELLAMGAERVIVGTKAVKDPDWLQQTARRFGAKVVVAVDAKGGEVVVKGWREATGIRLLDYARQVDKLGLGGIFFTDVDVEGKLTGINEMLIKGVVEAVDTPVLYAGGISSLDDLLMLQDLGVDAAVVGMALYTGRIDLGEALGALEA
ncbi:MAG TPA: 1-(5-phosphoribosyl)-5-[(5-phosphoribosylamino)methylideneamino]imidazole-4-carboxamide isomerase [Candidatus Thermoplasmatota archaeon]|jgi:phosphoribosylformimino-5-aminoimidazole carboxamide ribotide isomerase|nr:1-(5-phosphoribosyl)-5-[(5-phosphoribosylamino)methylideneamino]imidazole-4-carboxamide isomerase [Candidatus Thermoplasmatota archaeon]